MPIAKAERLLDLVIALLNSRYYRTATWIRDHVAGYGDAASDEAFARMSERDKQELRDMGIPIETDDRTDGYRIQPGDFALPPMSFTPAESAALAVAARLWDTTVLAGAEVAALRKVRDAATGDAGDADPAPDAEPAAGAPAAPDGAEDGAAQAAGPRFQARLRTAEPAFGAVFAAVRARRKVRFDYRGAADIEPTTRTVEPWGMVNSRGAWYVVGWDTGRAAQRTFRLSRIVGAVTASGKAGAVTVPAGIDLQQAVVMHPDSGGETAALVRIRAGKAAGLRRGGTVLHRFEPGGVDEVRIPMPSLADAARRIAGHGADVEVIDPPELRAAVIALLTGAVGDEEGGR